jgi:hypothetical protein
MAMGRGKPGGTSVDPASKGSNPAKNSGGNPGKSMPQGPIPGATKTGGPVSLKKALAKKTLPPKGM